MNSQHGPLPDPLRETRIVKRWVQIGVYVAVTLPLPLYYFFLAFNVLQLGVWYGVALVIATSAIEGAFREIFRLRKQSAYPHILAVQLGAVQDMREACELSLRLVGHYLSAKAAFLAWVNNSGQLVPICSNGMSDDRVQLIASSGSHGDAVRRVLKEQQPVLARASEFRHWAAGFDDSHNAALIPLASMNGLSAVVFLVTPGRASAVRDPKLLESIGIAIGRTLENIRLSNREYQSIMRVLCNALDMRDSATLGHSQRVSRMAVLVARQMELPRNEIKWVEQAAALHDIGKIGVADEVLCKVGPLTSDEWVEMRRHPRLGYEIVADIEPLQHAADIIHSHHERFDGGGYPRGLRGEEIPIGARIFAIVDSYDAMTSHRPYRRARSHQEAIGEIVRNSGTQFDPAAVLAFLEVERAGLIVPHDPPDPGQDLAIEVRALAAGQLHDAGDRP